ncbi:hypothetical protein EXIGLDRAFT_109270 [Exidia glandulosa HHB12029]|uniref:Secreted protein n=1 Tax=Exidia glandulosa HHB12029 TaxID=1314781 RepID=A0A165GQ60_EXIGL|nr:hypothetical protein EXIGLDRAFT_109270 [Exidia glandulosa HHB12029]
MNNLYFWCIGFWLRRSPQFFVLRRIRRPCLCFMLLSCASYDASATPPSPSCTPLTMLGGLATIVASVQPRLCSDALH